MITVTQLFGILMLSVLASVPAGAVNQQRVTELPAFKESSFTPPTSLDELYALSKCVVHVRMNEGRERAYDIPLPSPGSRPPIRTEFQPEVLEVFKADEHKCAPGMLRIVQTKVANGVAWHGRMYRQPGPKLLDPGAEYVLFLVWHPAYDAYDFMFPGAASFKLLPDGPVAVDDPGALAQSWSGQRPDRLLAALRVLQHRR